MKITIAQRNNHVKFGGLRPGSFFKDPQTGRVFIKSNQPAENPQYTFCVNIESGVATAYQDKAEVIPLGVDEFVAHEMDVIASYGDRTGPSS